MLQELQGFGEASLARAAVKPKLFAHPRMVHVRLDPDLHRRLRMIVAAEDTSVQEWMAQVVEKAVLEQWPKVAKGRERQ